jgi:hypothetical protein
METKRVDMDKIERRSLMLMMRHSGLTLQEIGDKFDLSRERVRQIIGNTGRHIVTDYKRDIIRENPDVPTRILAEQTGISPVVIARYSRGIRRPLAESATNVWIGEQGEVWINDHLNSLGLDSRLTNNRHNHYDLVVNDYKIDVKTTTKPWSPPSLEGKSISPSWRFSVKCGNGRLPVDFYICVIDHEQNKDVFVIPYGAIPIPSQHITFCWPSMRPEIGKYQKYYERYDLLER